MIFWSIQSMFTIIIYFHSILIIVFQKLSPVLRMCLVHENPFLILTESKNLIFLCLMQRHNYFTESYLIWKFKFFLLLNCWVFLSPIVFLFARTYKRDGHILPESEKGSLKNIEHCSNFFQKISPLCQPWQPASLLRLASIIALIQSAWLALSVSYTKTVYRKERFSFLYLKRFVVTKDSNSFYLFTLQP